MKRIQMREHTRRAVSDISSLILAQYGIVPTFHEVLQMAVAVDREMLRFGDCCVSATPEAWKEIKADVVKEVSDQYDPGDEEDEYDECFLAGTEFCDFDCKIRRSMEDEEADGKDHE